MIDLIDMKAFEHESEARRGGSSESEIPEELREQAEEYREKLMDEVAENSDELMERYLEGEEISHDEIVAALKSGVTEGHLFPVTCGVATSNLGTNRLLEALVEDLPSPAMRGPVSATIGSGEDASRSRSRRTRTATLVAYVFKTRADPYAGRINLFRVCSGTLRADSHVDNVTRRQQGADRPAARPRGQGDDAGRRARRRATSAPSPSSRRPAPATCSADGDADSASRRSTCPRR